MALQNAETSGRFCSMEQIAQHEAYPDLTKLIPLASAAVVVVTDQKEVDGETYYRLNNGKVRCCCLCMPYCKQALQQLAPVCTGCLVINLHFRVTATYGKCTTDSSHACDGHLMHLNFAHAHTAVECPLTDPSSPQQSCLHIVLVIR